MVVSAVRNYERKEKERIREKKPKYRHGKDTTGIRARKKMLENITWFRNNKDKKKDNNDLERENGRKRWRHQIEKATDSPQAVIFVPCTENSALAKEIREIILKLKPFTSINLKVVERSGKKLIDTLHKSNPWENAVCEREDCLPCDRSKRDQEEAVKSFKRRSILYQTWCHTCRCETKRAIEEREADKIIEEKNDKKRKRDMGKKKESKEELKKRIEKKW